MDAGYDHPVLYPEAIDEIRNALARASADWDYLSAISGGGPVRRLETLLAHHLGGRWVVAMSSCSMALHVALLAAGVGPGDEVILPAVTWPQVLFSVLHCGARPVFADLSHRALTVDPKCVADLLTPRTKAIVAAHLYGFPADVARLRHLADRAGCPLVVDAAQGVGALLEGRPVGSVGDVVAFSFGRGKLLSAGEGGALLCRRRALYERAVRFSQHPLRMHRDLDDPGLRASIDPLALNGRLHPLVASLAHGQLRGLVSRGVMAGLRRRFDRLVSALKEGGYGDYLPDTPAWGHPSGAALPLLEPPPDGGESIRAIADRHGYAWLEHDPPVPLYRLPRALPPGPGGPSGGKNRTQRRPAGRNARRWPNAEALSARRLVILKARVSPSMQGPCGTVPADTSTAFDGTGT